MAAAALGLSLVVHGLMLRSGPGRGAAPETGRADPGSAPSVIRLLSVPQDQKPSLSTPVPVRRTAPVLAAVAAAAPPIVPWTWQRPVAPQFVDDGAALPPTVLAQMRMAEMAGLSQQLTAVAATLAAELGQRIDCEWDEAFSMATCDVEPAAAVRSQVQQWLALTLRAHSLGMVRLPLDWVLAPGKGISIRLPAAVPALQPDMASPKALASMG